MPDLLKNLLSRELLSTVARDIQSVYQPFQVETFLKSTMDETWGSLELKDMTYKIAVNLGTYLPQDYGTAIGIIDKVVMNYGTWLDGRRIILLQTSAQGNIIPASIRLRLSSMV